MIDRSIDRLIDRPIDRIVVINDLARPQGGASLLAVNSARQFAERGYRVTMITGDSGPDADPGFETVSLGQERLLDSPVKALANGIYNRAARKMVAEWIATNDTPGTIYHVHGWSQILSPALFAALKPVRDRLVMSAHDFFATCPNGAFYDYSATRPCWRTPMTRDCITAQCDRRNYGHKLWRVARHTALGRTLGPRADEAAHMPPQLLIHAGMAPFFARSGLKEDDMVALPNPVVPWRRERIRAEENRDVLFVGRLEQTKGADLAAEACRRAGARLVAVGDGAMLDSLRKSYPEMDFRGRFPHERIGEVAASARMVVMPSRYMEPFGLTAVEALWSGLPVLAAHDALLADDLVQAGAGLAVDPRDADQFAGAIASLLHDDALTERMSRAAFEKTDHLAMQPDRWIDALLIAYKAMLAGGREALKQASLQWSGASGQPESAAVATRTPD